MSGEAFERVTEGQTGPRQCVSRFIHPASVDRWKQHEGSFLPSSIVSPMLFQPVRRRLCCKMCCSRRRAGCSLSKGTLREHSHLLPQSLLSSIPPSSISLSSGLASGLSSQVSLILVIFLFISSFDFLSLSLSLNLLSLLSGVLPPSLYLSLSIAGSVYRSPMSVRLYVHACVCLSVCLSVRPGGPHEGGECRDPHFLRGCWS